jgi:prefoldin subunit 5
MMNTIETYEKRFGDLNEMLGDIHEKLRLKDQKINQLEGFLKGNSIPSDLFLTRD